MSETSATPVATASAGQHEPLLALADQCVQCGLCLPHCPTYRLDRSEAESPRGRIAYMKAVASGSLAPTEAGDQHLDHCLGCRRCEAACPAGVRYGELLLGSRSHQYDRRRPALAARLAVALMQRPRWLGHLLQAYRLAYRALPRALRRLPRPDKRGKTTTVATLAVSTAANTPALFLGCIARGYEAPTAAALQRLLAAIDVAVVIPDGQTCCGAAAAHLGDAAGAAALAEQNHRAFAAHAQVMCVASGCRDQLASGLRDHCQVGDPLELLAASLPRLRFRPSTRRVALHLPCSQRSGPALRRLLAAVPGLAVLDLPATGCCGAAGLHMLAEPARAAALRAPLIDALADLGADELLSANIGCRLHLAVASPTPVRHPLDFLAEHLA